MQISPTQRVIDELKVVISNSEKNQFYLGREEAKKDVSEMIKNEIIRAIQNNEIVEGSYVHKYLEKLIHEIENLTL